MTTGNYNGWIEDWENSGGPFVTGNGTLQTALSLFGPLEVDGASLQEEKDKYSAVGHLFMTNKRSGIKSALSGEVRGQMDLFQKSCFEVLYSQYIWVRLVCCLIDNRNENCWLIGQYYVEDGFFCV